METIKSNINTLFAPYGLEVNDIITGAQSIKYVLNLPLDVKTQSKIKRAESDIKFALSSALNTNEFTYGHGTNCVYIEVKNDDFQVVKFSDLKDVTYTDRLTLVLGVDSDGKKVFTDLSKAPHILVGGTTGSGKSELLHTFVASLICGMPYTNSEIVIIDPKRAEYSPYKNCRRITLVTEMNQAVFQLDKAVEVMESRYTELERNCAKDIYHYNGEMDMHPIIIIIDELADLMETYPNVEKSIVRIAQKARACGIHLIIGTQSPRAKVVTGLIKANMPTRIALKTKSNLESRIILDKSGAENLYGKGDMLFLANGSFEPIRLQSAYVDEYEKIHLAESIKIDEYKNPFAMADNYKNGFAKGLFFFSKSKSSLTTTQKYWFSFIPYLISLLGILIFYNMGLKTFALICLVVNIIFSCIFYYYRKLRNQERKIERYNKLMR